tara:strand:- start:15891 stop:16475 length:585 start_codon:yes stop_codon:yes gene_type:complete
MRNIKLFIVTSIFSSFLVGCGMKGPLYRASTTEPVKPMVESERPAPVELQSTTEVAPTETQKSQQPITVTEVDASTPELKVKKDVISQKFKKLFTPADQLLAIPPSYLTLQLAAMDSDKSLQQFVEQHNLPQKDVYIYQTIHNNQPRYVVLFGKYESRQSAVMASKRLPDTFSNTDTWIKTYQLVHQELLLNNR